ncbi:MAG: serine/threonine protein kinase [Planctomycetes bacterium]|nr:serine/threonine protein kinase [Planctomycetota bacterium]
MIAPRCSFDRAQLSQLLAGELAEPVAEEVTRHLDDCDTCRSQLELLAAGAGWWEETRQFLSDDELSSLASPIDLSRSPGGDVAAAARDMVAGLLQPAEDRSLLGRLDEYDIVEVIGCGGMGIVLKGYDRQLNRHVAIKLLAPHFAVNAAARKRFAREAQAAAAVVHPHVLAIHGVNAGARLPYLVMPFVAGRSLQQCLDDDGPLDVRDTVRISLQAAQGLAAAHAQGLVHRDVKPANILLENGVQRVFLTDFGLARAIDDVSLTCSGTIAGTPQYMSPEQSRGEIVDHRTDLFSLGSVMYAMCVGRPPFRADTTMGVLRRISDDAPRDPRELNPDVPNWLAAVITKLLAKAPDARFQSADELARLLERCMAHLQHPTAVALPEAVAALVAGRRTTWFAAHWPVWSALAVVVAAAMFWGVHRYGSHEREPPQRGDVAPGTTESPFETGREPRAASGDVPSWNDRMDGVLDDIDARVRMLKDEEQLAW